MGTRPDRSTADGDVSASRKASKSPIWASVSWGGGRQRVERLHIGLNPRLQPHRLAGRWGQRAGIVTPQSRPSCSGGGEWPPAWHSAVVHLRCSQRDVAQRRCTEGGRSAQTGWFGSAPSPGLVAQVARPQLRHGDVVILLGLSADCRCGRASCNRASRRGLRPRASTRPPRRPPDSDPRGQSMKV